MTEIKNEQKKDLTPSRSLIGRARAVDRIWTVVFYLVALFFLLLLFAFAGYVIIKGFAGATPEMFRFDRNGIGNYFFNTIYLVFLSLLISVPIGVMGGIYMAEYARDNAFTKFLRIAIETLSSLPSIVVGLFGYLIFLVATHSQPSLLAVSFIDYILVAILSLPLMTTTTEDALRNLPPSYKLGSLGMGATLRQTIQSVLIPACVPRIITGIILAAGRGFGEAAALLYTSGSDTNIKWDPRAWVNPSLNPFNPLRRGGTLSLKIWSSFTASVGAEDVANLSAAILMILVLSFSLLAHYLEGRIRKKMGDTK